MKLKIFIAVFVYLLGLLYLVLPSPIYPDLSSAERSDEPGDTWQNPDQKGYYTNLTRAEVFSQVQSKYTVKFMGLTIPSYRLNYRPEEAFTLVRDQLNSYYLEEIVYPFRESLFVNGWEPTHSPRYVGKAPDEIPNISFRGVPFMSKVTFKPINSLVVSRISIWTLIFPTAYLVCISLKKSLKNAQA